MPTRWQGAGRQLGWDRVTVKSTASTLGSAVTAVSFRSCAGVILPRPDCLMTHFAPATVARRGACEVDQLLPVEPFVDDVLDEVVLTSWEVAA